MPDDLTRLTYTCRVCCRSIITTVATPRPHVTHTGCPTCGQRRAVVLGRAYATHGAGINKKR